MNLVSGRWWSAGVVLLLPILVACSSGQPSAGFVEPRLIDAYIPLSQRQALIFSHWAAAFAIAPNVGVTNDHNLRFIPPDRILARSRDYDLLFFRTDSRPPPAIATPRPGEQVIAYGQGASDELREAHGVVARLTNMCVPDARIAAPNAS